MSNDIKTLADVQPGGRVRLGDQAERARFEAWAEERELDTAKCSADGMKGDYADLNTDWCWAAWRAALSAQPSPGGQEDALRVIAERLRGAGANLPAPPITGTISGSMVTGLSIALALVEEALAARQPAKQPDSVALGEATEFCTEKAARQPAGKPITVEAVAEIFNHPEYGLSINWLLENGIGELQVGDVLMVADQAITDEDGSGEVYAAATAQAVDPAPASIPDTPEVRDILGRPNFWCSPWANVLRRRGDVIPCKAEEEQAAVIRFMLNHYLAHGAGWAEAAEAEIQAIRYQVMRND